jgi:hypothetical protein
VELGCKPVGVVVGVKLGTVEVAKLVIVDVDVVAVLSAKTRNGKYINKASALKRKIFCFTIIF